MKSLAEIIREQLQEDSFVRAHEAEIIRYCIARSTLTQKKAPGSVRCDEAATNVMEETKVSG